MFFCKWFRLKLMELETMSALTDALNRNTASADALVAALAAQPAPFDQAAAAAQLNATSDKLDAAKAALPPTP